MLEPTGKKEITEAVVIAALGAAAVGVINIAIEEVKLVIAKLRKIKKEPDDT